MALANKNANANTVSDDAAKTPTGTTTPGAAPSATTPQTNSATQSNKKDITVLHNQGAEVIAKMTDEERNNMGEFSKKIQFQHLLGLGSKTSTRRVNGTSSEKCPFPVGAEFLAIEDVIVPNAPVGLSKTSEFDASQLTWVAVKAGEKFFLTQYEYMYLVARPEYAGAVRADGDPEDGPFSCTLQTKITAFFNGAAKLPTPTINLRAKSIKANTIVIEEKVGDKWVMKPEYLEKFGSLTQRRTVSRGTGNKSAAKVQTERKVAMAINQLLKVGSLPTAATAVSSDTDAK